LMLKLLLGHAKFLQRVGEFLPLLLFGQIGHDQTKRFDFAVRHAAKRELRRNQRSILGREDTADFRACRIIENVFQARPVRRANVRLKLRSDDLLQSCLNHVGKAPIAIKDRAVGRKRYGAFKKSTSRTSIEFTSRSSTEVAKLLIGSITTAAGLIC